MKTVAIGADHAGFELKEQIKSYLSGKGYRVEDVGCFGPESVDYPDYAKAVARKVSTKSADAGILICGTGIGMSITANRTRGVRAALVGDVSTAKLSREHNDANVLVLGARTMNKDRAIEIVETWFNSSFEGGRHARRVDKIEEQGTGDLS